MGAPISPGFEPPLSGPGPVLNRSRLPTGREQRQSIGRRLHKSDLEAPRCGNSEEVWRNIAWPAWLFRRPAISVGPNGVPFVFWDFEMQMLQQPDKITILYWSDHQVRHVRMKQPHPAHVTPSWYGDSVGHYEGDTLVIDTVGIKVGPFAMVDMYGTPYTEALHVVERYRLLDYEAAKEGARTGRKGEFPPSG